MSAQLGGLLPVTPSLELRLLLTVGLLAAVGIIAWLGREARRRTDLRGTAARVSNVVIAAAVVSIAGVLLVAVVSLWEGTPAVDAVLSVTAIEDPLTVASRIVVTLILVVGAYLLTGFVKNFVHRLTVDRAAITQHQTELVYRITQVGIYILAGVVALGIWRVDLGGLLVGAGFLGIVIGLAARQTLGSLIAGFVLMFARPFEIGDWVQIGDREGIVTEISIVNTRIQTFDGEFAMIPNDLVSSQEVINRTRKGRLRSEVRVGVDYETDLEEAMDVAVSAMRDVDDVLAVPQPRAVLIGFDNSAITIGLRFWIDKPSSRRRWRAQTAVVAAVKAAFDAADIKIPFPQRELMGRSEAGGFRVANEGHDADGSGGG